jgi:hypothetical protein
MSQGENMAQRITSILTIITAISSLSLLAVPAYADDGGGATENSTPNTAAVLATVRGKAVFERHSTIVPLQSEQNNINWKGPEICFNGVCPKPQYYWSLVVVSVGSKTELNTPLAFGATRAPDVVELEGAAIHSGDEIELRGELQSFSRSYSVISQLRSAEVLPAAHQGLLQSSNNLSFIGGPVAPIANDLWDSGQDGWTCHGSSAQGTVEVVIWYGQCAQSPTNGSYHLRASYQGGGAVTPQVMTQIDQIQPEEQSDSTIYAGSSPAASIAANLTIYHQDPRVFDEPANFRYQKADSWGNAVSPVYADLSVVCNPTHLSESAF